MGEGEHLDLLQFLFGSLATRMRVGAGLWEPKAVCLGLKDVEESQDPFRPSRASAPGPLPDTGTRASVFLRRASPFPVPDRELLVAWVQT